MLEEKYLAISQYPHGKYAIGADSLKSVSTRKIAKPMKTQEKRLTSRNFCDQPHPSFFDRWSVLVCLV
jgi:hypothetical protein